MGNDNILNKNWENKELMEIAYYNSKELYISLPSYFLFGFQTIFPNRLKGDKICLFYIFNYFIY